MQKIDSEIFGYFKEKFNGQLKGDTNLFQAGALDSMGVVELVGYLEKTFSVSIEPDDMLEENFSSVDAIVTLIEGKLR